MMNFKKLITAAALIAGILVISIPLAAGAHKKLAKESKLNGLNTSQMMIDVKDLPTFHVAEPY